MNKLDEPKQLGMLSGLRAIDLTDGKGWLSGRILADMGTEVIKVEVPGGDPDRSKAPFYKGDPQKSLYWVTYNAGKKSVTIDLTHPQGKTLFLKLVENTDFILESFTPGYLTRLGLDYDMLSQVNQRVILTSITPFGQTGPRRLFPASDITLQALAGVMFQIGELGRQPLKLCLEQSYLLASAHACAATLMALYNRGITGLGQYVDVSIFECLVRLNYREPMRWEIKKVFSRRAGNRMVLGNLMTRFIWHSKDGYVSWYFMGGPPGARENYPLVKWMVEENITGVEVLQRMKWEELDLTKIGQAELERLEAIFDRFFRTHTKAELWEGSKKRRLTIVPVNNIQEVRDNEQLSARRFWETLLMPGIGEVSIPAHFFLASETNNRVRGRSPGPGEHNQEIFQSLAGLDSINLQNFTKQRII